MGVLTAILILASVLGNGFLLAIIARFKSLRTVPNILVANLALVDLFNAVSNLPPQMTFFVLEFSWFRGKTMAIMTSISIRYFTMLNLASMFAMMTNMYLAISFGLRYLGWKSNKKALVCVVLIWFISFVTVMLSSIPLFEIDLGEAHVSEYRIQMFKQARQFLVSFVAFFLIFGAVVCFLTIRAIKRKKKERAELNIPPIHAEARLNMDIKATKTIAITVAAYFLCYGPAIVFAVVAKEEALTLTYTWFGLIAWYSLYISSAVNPIIYYLRTSRCRSAFKQFLKDPFGSSDFKEKPNGRGNGEKCHDRVMASKRNGERVESEEAFKVDRGGNQMRQKCIGKRGEELVASSIGNLQAEHHSHHKVGDGSGYEAGRGSGQSLQVQETEERNGEEPKKCGLEKKSRKPQPSSSRKKVHPLGITELGKNGERDEENQEVRNHCSSREGNRQSSRVFTGKADIITGSKFERFLKTACIIRRGWNLDEN